MASETDLVMYRGDDRAFLITVSGIDLTSADVTFTAKRKVTDDDADALISLTTPTEVQVTSSTTLMVNIPSEATDVLPAGVNTRLYWDLQVVISNDVRTLPEASATRSTLGTLLIRPDVTRAAP